MKLSQFTGVEWNSIGGGEGPPCSVNAISGAVRLGVPSIPKLTCHPIAKTKMSKGEQDARQKNVNTFDFSLGKAKGAHVVQHVHRNLQSVELKGDDLLRLGERRENRRHVNREFQRR